MIRYLFSLIVFFAGIVLAIFTAGGSVWNYLDIPSLIIAGIMPFLFTSVVFGFKEMGSAFSVSMRKGAEKEKLLDAVHFFKVYGRVTWIAGCVAVLIGVIAMLVNLEDKTALGPNFALALTSMLYSGILYVVIILPFTVFIKKQLKR